MKFTLTALLAMSALVSAAPAPASLPQAAAARTALVRRDGPSGTLVSPPGQNPEVGGYESYKIGDQIKLVYQKVRTEEATTTAINATLITYDGKVTFNANNISVSDEIRTKKWKKAT